MVPGKSHSIIKERSWACSPKMNCFYRAKEKKGRGLS